MTEYFTPIPFPLWREDKQAFSDAIGRSFRETGFAVIDQHPVDLDIIQRAIDASKAFFALPEDVKEKYHDAANGRQRGYTPFGTENAKGAKAADLKEFWHTGRAKRPRSRRV
jgi:isopenicillin N synthase-like dioxygenase